MSIHLSKTVLKPPPLKTRPVRCLASSKDILKKKSIELQDVGIGKKSFRYVDREPMLVGGEEMSRYFALLEVDEIRAFLDKDKCRIHADRYLLAIVFIYFKRADLTMLEYTPHNFWVALYLAHDQEEEEDHLKWEILPWALGQNWWEKRPSFFDDKVNFWKRMNYRSAVSRR